MKITKNFSYEEFFASEIAKKENLINYPSGDDCPRIVDNVVKIAFVLQRLRDNYGHPITITSGYRCVTLNQLVGGVVNSYHLYGRAVDLYANDMLNLGRCLKTLTCELFDTFEQQSIITKVIKEKTWYHVQFTPAIERMPLVSFIGWLECKNKNPYYA